MAEQIDLRCDTTHEDGDAPAEKRARTLTLHNERVDCADSASTAKSPIAIRPDERGAMTAPAAPADAAPVPPPATPRRCRGRQRRRGAAGRGATRRRAARAPPAAPPVDLADAAAGARHRHDQGLDARRSAIVDVKRPRYDAAAAAPADPPAPRSRHRGARVAASWRTSAAAKATPAPAVARDAHRRVPFQRGTGYEVDAVCRRHRSQRGGVERDECPADIHVLWR